MGPSSSPPYFPQVKQTLGTGTPGKSPGRNVSRYNVRRKAYTSRNMDTSSKSVESKYSFQGTDTINYSNSTIVDVPLFSRPRPEGLKSLTASEHSSASALGARGGVQDLCSQASASGGHILDPHPNPAQGGARGLRSVVRQGVPHS